MFLPSRLSIAVAAALLLIGAGLTWGIYEVERSRREEAFAGLLVELSGYVETRVEQHIALLSATQSFLAVHDEPTSQGDFAAFVDGLHLDQRYPGLQELGFARILGAGDEAQVKSILGQVYGGERPVWPEAWPGLRTAVMLLEPDDRRDHVAIGFDMATEEEPRRAMLEALETGAVTATAPLTLAHGITDGRPAGILIYLPLRESTNPEVEGFAFAPVRVGDLFDEVLEEYDLPLELCVTDGATGLPVFATADFAEDEAQRSLESHTSLSVAGREWLLSAVPSPTFGRVIQLRLTLFSALVFPCSPYPPGLPSTGRAPRSGEAVP